MEALPQATLGVSDTATISDLLLMLFKGVADMLYIGEVLGMKFARKYRWECH